MKKLKFRKEELIEELTLLSKKFNRRPVKRDDERLCQRVRKHFGSWNNGLEKGGFEIKRKQMPQTPDIEKNELYYFLGLLITDGHIVYNRGKNYQLKLYTSYKEEKEMIIKLIHNLFDYKASVRERKTEFSDRINYEVYISSKELCKFIVDFSKIPSGAKSTNVKVPDLLFKSNNHQIGNFIRGVIDGDGTILKNPLLKVVSGSKEFLFGLKELLNKIEIKSGKIYQERKNLYSVWIYGKDNLKKLKEVLYKNYNSFCYLRKRRKWEQYI